MNDDEDMQDSNKLRVYKFTRNFDQIANLSA